MTHVPALRLCRRSRWMPSDIDNRIRWTTAQRSVSRAVATLLILGVLASWPAVLHAQPVTATAMLDANNGGVPHPSARPRALTLDRHVARSTGAVRGTVTDSATHAPVTGATIAVNGREPRTVTDADGAYRLVSVPAGTITLTVQRLGYRPVSREVMVVADSETVVNVALAATATMLDQVVVTGTVVPTEVKALPTPITVITADQIARQHSFTLAAIMRQAIPTAVAFDSPSNPANTFVSVRGTTSLNGTGSMKVFVDGVEATSFGSSPVDPTSIERIEIIRGPEAATIYGANAAAGVIQVFTKRGTVGATRPRIDAQVAMGIAQTPYAGFQDVLRQRYSASVHGGGAAMSYNFGGGYKHLATYAPKNGNIEQSAPSAYGAVHITRGMLTADMSARYYDNEVPTGINPLATETGYAQESRPFYLPNSAINETYGARITLTPRSWWRSQLTVGVDRSTLQQHQTQPRLITPTDTLLLLLDDGSRKLSIGYNATLSGALTSQLGGSLTLGIDHYGQEVSSIITTQARNRAGTIETAPPGAFNVSLNSVTNTGYFSQAQLSVHDALFLTAGVRAEDNSTFGTDYGTTVLPRVGFSFVQQIGATTVKVRGSYGKALRTPGAGQASGSVNAGSIQLANPKLGPERQKGWDGGFDLVFGNRKSLSVSLFDQTARDLIAFLQVASTPLPTYQNRNIGRVSNRGIEVEGRFGIGQRLLLRAQYGYVRSRVEAVDTTATGGTIRVGDEPLKLPAHTAGAALTWTPHGGTTLTTGVTYVGSYRQTDVLAELRCLASFTAAACPASFLSTFATRDFIVTYPGFAKVNATIAHTFTQHLEAFLSVDNLTNNEAYEGSNIVPVMGRTTTLGMHLTY